MGTIAKLRILLDLDDTGFTRNLGGARSALDSFGQKMTAWGRNLTAGVTAPLVLAGAAFVNWAVDTNEQINKVDVVFGDNAKAITDWSKTTATNLGIARVDALAMAGTFGNLFTAMGIGQQESADMSMGLVTLAADLASFNNMDPTEVLDKLRAGLVGEVEPLRALGIQLDAATVKERALAMGLAVHEDALTPAMLAQARYALIMEQSANAQRDFAETSGSLANRMRILRARFKDLGARIGQDLLPFAERLAGWGEKVLGFFERMDPSMRKVLLVLAAIAVVIGPVLLVLGALATAMSSIVGLAGVLGFSWLGLLGPLALLAAAVAALSLAWSLNLGGIRDPTREGASRIAEFVDEFIEVFRRLRARA